MLSRVVLVKNLHGLKLKLTVSAITAIKDKYHVQKNWMGDPCLPKTLAWNGLTCSYAIASSPRITGV